MTSGPEPAGSGTRPIGSPVAAARPQGSPTRRSSLGQAAAQKPQSVTVDPQLKVGKIKLQKGETLFQVRFEGLGLVIKSIRPFRRVLARRLSHPCSPTGEDRYNLPWGQSTGSPRVSAAAGLGPAPYLVLAAFAQGRDPAPSVSVCPVASEEIPQGGSSAAASRAARGRQNLHSLCGPGTARSSLSCRLWPRPRYLHSSARRSREGLGGG